jgi:hypothetical protein
MQLVLLAITILGAIFAYFAAGIAFRWFLEWWILAISTPILIAVGILFGWAGALVALIGFPLALSANNAWHSSNTYFRISDRLNKLFYFEDV